MVLKFIETGNQSKDDLGVEDNWKAPRYDFDTIIFEKDLGKVDGASILLDSNTVVVDFDEHPHIALEVMKLYPTFMVQTDRGFHLYYHVPDTLKEKKYLKNSAGVITVAGCLVDYKTGKALGNIKQKGIERQHTKFEIMGGDLKNLPDLPPLLHPHKFKNNPNKVLTGLDEGDGRNNAIYSHLKGIQDWYTWDSEDLKEIARFINNVIFENPMQETELLSTMNSAIFSVGTEMVLNPKEYPMETWETLINQLNVKLYNDKLYFHYNGRWINDENRMIRQVYNLVKLRMNQVKEFLAQAKFLADRVDPKEFPIQLKNGYILRNSPFPTKMSGGFTPYHLNVNYNVDAYCKEVDEFLNFVTCNREDVRILLEELLGHILMTHGFPQHVFFITNKTGSNGKSTFLEMVDDFVGELSSNISLEDFNDNTSVASLEGKLVNLGDDIDPAYMEKSKNFKTLASGNVISIRPIYSQPYKLRNRATFIFTANKMPTFKDKSGGMKRRIVVIPFDAKVTQADPNIREKLSTDEAKSYLLNLALKGLKRIQANGGKMTIRKAVADSTRDYFESSDSVVAYLNEWGIENLEINAVYQRYTEYCEEEARKPIGKRNFFDKLEDMGYERVRALGEGRIGGIITFKKKED